ncbi:DUF262 domain-containing protein [Nocardioides panacis]|uniref:DUF262 domain-containing protein n=1 Tax=Nocardioides panacis TaxID=2849501 RepID=A0A975T1N0_9ACTN|nr:DUF262 domain-containing protein [Nocardioides panacis]QWZ09234.1 DUF262 domain-containing protein [Nocardioides panacis]
MAFQPPVTVEHVLKAIHNHEYLLPAIQREFVWNPDQIRRLMDSLMRGYPIGSFLLWKVEAQTGGDYTFYDFLTHYHERDNPYASKATVPAGQPTTAILDGQQRLTSLNVAVYGSHAEKKKYAWWNSPDAFPKKRLFLNLLEDPKDEELGFRYDLRFLTDAEATAKPGDPDGWFRVGAVLELANAGPAMHNELTNRGVINVEGAYQRLYDLHEALRVKQPINHYLETSQNADKVLEIFVRVNSGGTTLSYSDLLLSMATNQWKQLDAREEVRALVTELNTGGTRQFSFSKDLVLKAALMIAGVDLRFRVSNFTQANMDKVESAWPDIQKALIRAASLMHQFGFSERTLTADSVIIPLACYLHRRKVADSYLTSDVDAEDRLEVQRWITRSLVKRGIWGSGLDTTLTRVRDVLDLKGETGFPVDAVETVMATIGKSLAFEETEIDELLTLKYAGQRTFAALSILYPGLDFSKEFHEDHVYPKSRFTTKRLLEAGVPVGQVELYRESYNLLPNLQLLGGIPNMEKRDKLPSDWAETSFPTHAQRESYLLANDLHDVSLQMTSFLEFFEKRKARMRVRLTQALGVPTGADALVATAARVQ